jgi:uncharacterized protein (TIGR02302 family)
VRAEETSTAKFQAASRRLLWLQAGSFLVLLLEIFLPVVLSILSLWLGLLGLAWLGLFQTLPALLQDSALPLGLGLTGFLMWRERSHRFPRLADALMRLDREHQAKTRPASSFADRLVLNPSDPLTQKLWQTYQEKLAEQVLNLRPALPRPAFSPSDPYALRSLALLVLVTGFFATGPERNTRFWAAFSFSPASSQQMAWREDGWIDPPVYTQKPPLLLDLSAFKDGEHKDLTVPTGSVIVLRRSGGGILTPEPSGTLLRLPSEHESLQKDQDVRFKINGSGSIRLPLLGHRMVTLRFAVVPDTPPQISLLSPPVQDNPDSLIFHYNWQDDYGVAKGIVEITGTLAGDQKTAHPPLLEPPALALSFLPDPHQGESKQKLRFENNLWSGLEVEARLKVEDDAGQSGVSETFRFTLPQRYLTHPLARALDEQRKALVQSPANQKKVLRALEALMVAPDLFTPQFGIYLGLHRARQWLARPVDKARLIETAQWLWDMAALLEKDDLADAQRALEAAQNALRDAMDRDASPQELQQLSEAVRQALNRLMQALAERMQKDDPNQAQNGEQNSGRVLTPQDLQALMNQLDQALKRGDQAEAMRLLEQLQQMTRNLQTARPNRRGSSGQQQALDEMQNMTREQQNLRDKTYREGLQRQQDRRQPSDGKSGEGPLSDLQKNQQALREGLQALRNKMREKGMDQQGFGEAEESMREAEGALGEGRESEALDAQNRALQNLRKGAEQLAQQMQQQRQQGGEGETGDNPGDDPSQNAQGDVERDPLGRPLPAPRTHDRSRLYEDGRKTPSEERARALLEELRRRLGEVNRPQVEIDYLLRLLQSESLLPSP